MNGQRKNHFEHLLKCIAKIVKTVSKLSKIIFEVRADKKECGTLHDFACRPC